MRPLDKLMMNKMIELQEKKNYIIDNIIGQYMMLHNLKNTDLLVNGQRQITLNSNLEIFLYKDEVILAIDIEYTSKAIRLVVKDCFVKEFNQCLDI